jgi:hypothetical protein
MELLKVFVGDGAASAVGSALSKNTMVKGDLLLLDATTHAIATGSSTAVVIAGCNDKGIYVSAPITNANIKYLNYQTYTSPVEATSTVAINATPLLVAGDTYTVGVQIKEDLRMGTYNKNTEILASYVVPSSAVITNTATNFVYLKEMASNLAKGFAANPLTSAGAPSQLIKAVRTATGGTLTALGMAAGVTKGARQVTATSHGRAVGDFVALDGALYQIEAVTTNSFTLDTAFQGATASLSSNIAGGAGQAAYYSVVPTAFNFVFTSLAQTQQNRYDQFRMVDFVIVTPKGNSTGIFTVTSTAPTYPTGSYRQVRDLEEKAYTNSMPLINYREFPFETFPLNADSGTNYAILTIGFVSSWGYNYMQSNQNEFLHTVVVAAPAVDGSQFDSVNSPANSSNFATTFNAWYTGTDPFSNLT